MDVRTFVDALGADFFTGVPDSLLKALSSYLMDTYGLNAIPTIFVVGWRGEPGVKDEPQHVFQGEITVSLLELLGIKTFILSQETAAQELHTAVAAFREELKDGRDVAFVVRKGALTYEGKPVFKNAYTLKREEVIGAVTQVSGRDPVISTTGKASRELFELRVARE